MSIRNKDVGQLAMMGPDSQHAEQRGNDSLRAGNLMGYQPVISVVIPTYNRAQKTIAAVESVLAQTYPHREIIVVDDGSTDGSTEVLQEFVSQRTSGIGTGNDQQLRYFHQPNQGPGAARNAGIAKARGKYIAFLDSDDVWLPEKLEWQMRALDEFQGECGACFTDAQMVHNSGEIVNTFAFYGRNYDQATGIEPNAIKLLARSFGGFWLSTLVARTDLIRRIGGFDLAVGFSEDSDFYFRLSQITSLTYVNKLFARVDRTTQPNDSDCRKWEKIEVRLQAKQYMLEKWLNAGPALSPDVRKAASQYLREVYSQWTNWYLETGRYSQARSAASKAVQAEFTFGAAIKWILTWSAPALARKITAKAPPYL
jgi:glycosyltransferase involved in cell wall biosynthesis